MVKSRAGKHSQGGMMILVSVTRSQILHYHFMIANKRKGSVSCSLAQDSILSALYLQKTWNPGSPVLIFPLRCTEMGLYASLAVENFSFSAFIPLYGNSHLLFSLVCKLHEEDLCLSCSSSHL